MRRSVYVGAIVVFILTCLVYTPALKNDFVWDDAHYVSENTLIRSLSVSSFYKMVTSFQASNWHPLTWVSLAIDYAFWGLDPFGYHLTNIIFHGLNTLLVFFLVLRLSIKAQEGNGISLPSERKPSVSSQTLTVAGSSALLFGLHPLHVESVAWVAERKDLLCAFFVFLSSIAYLSYSSSVIKRQQWSWFTICLFFFILALMSKPMAVTLPLILLLLDIYPLKRLEPQLHKNLSVLWEKIPFFVLSIVSSIITISAQHAGGAVRTFEQFPIDIRLLNALRTLVFYLEKMVVPVKLVPFYPFSSQIQWLDLRYLLSGILVLAITAGCLWFARQGRYLLFVAWSYYVITLLPVLGIIQVGGQATADRYTYLPCMGIFVLIGVGISWCFEKGALLKRKSMLGVLVVTFICIFVILGRLTVKQIKIWHDSEILWSYVVSAFPFPKSDPLVHYNLGNAYARKGELDKSISEYKRALILKPSYPEAYNNLGSVYIKKGKVDEAIFEYTQALAINPRYAKAHNNLGSAYLKKGELDEAISEYKQAIAIEPSDAEAHNNMGLAYQTKGMLDEAISEYKRTLSIKPNSAEAHYNLSVAYYYKGNYKLAIVHCDRSIGLRYRVNAKLLELLKPYR